MRLPANLPVLAPMICCSANLQAEPVVLLGVDQYIWRRLELRIPRRISIKRISPCPGQCSYLGRWDVVLRLPSLEWTTLVDPIERKSA